jgi:hypothetical protein
MFESVRNAQPVGWHITGRCDPEVYTLMLALPGDVVCPDCAIDGIDRVEGVNPLDGHAVPLSLLGETLVACPCCEQYVNIRGGDR